MCVLSYIPKIAPSSASSSPPEERKRRLSPTPSLPGKLKRQRSNSEVVKRSKESPEGAVHRRVRSTNEMKRSKVTDEVKKKITTEDVRRCTGEEPKEDNRLWGIAEGSRLRSSAKDVPGPRSKPGVQISGRRPGVTTSKPGVANKGHFLKGAGVKRRDKKSVGKVSHMFNVLLVSKKN